MDKVDIDNNICSGVNFDIEIRDLNISPNTMADDSSDGVFDEHTDQLLISMDQKLMEQDMDSQNSEVLEEEPPPPPPPKKSKPDKTVLLEFIDQGLNKNTKIKTEKDAKKFCDYIRSQGENRDVTELSQSEVDFLFGSYIMQLRKPDGDFYEPSTITSIHRYRILLIL